MSTNSLSDHLVANKILTKDDALQATGAAKTQQISLVSYLLQNKLLDYKQIANQIANYFDLPQVDLDNHQPDSLPISLLDNKLIAKYAVLPIAQHQNSLQLAIADPTNREMIDEIKFHCNLDIQLLVAEYDKLNKIIDNLSSKNRYAEFDTKDAHIINFVAQIINDAVNSNASDIHFEPYQTSYRIRFRIDGILYEITRPEPSLAKRLAARLKIMANLDIAEHRLPQDGRFSVNLTNSEVRDCRINTCPTMFGEKIVIRILNPNSSAISIDDLGLEPQQQQLFCQAISNSQGMILVTGPTGSGKTITLYSALHRLNSVSKNISTAEDPIEINLPGINQVNIKPKIGLNFATVLRAFLRQDPDIIMLGEVRDQETAEIAIKAAQTGHLVLSTLHTNSAAESITRLLNMNIAAFNITSAVSLIIAQRLVRKLCPHCKQPANLPEKTLLEQGFETTELDDLLIYTAAGCDHCQQGYQGRSAIFEMLPISTDISSMILAHNNSTDIFNQAQQEGQLSLRLAALNKVRAGITSLEEINRIS